MSTLAAALALIKKGFKVFPIPAGTKVPTLKAWPDRATADEAQIRTWWTDAVGDEEHHNIGVCCNDLLVIDIEGEAKGFDPLKTLKAVEADVGRLYFLVNTPSGGYHAYMRLPEGVRVSNTGGKIWPGTDTRSWHGQVLGPGSVVNDKTYEWEISGEDGNRGPASIDELPVAPQHLIDRIGAPKERAPVDPSVEWDTPAATKWAENYLKHEAKPSIMFNKGNNNAYKVACRLFENAVSECAALDMMLGEWNQRCEPPWPAEELDAIVASAYRRAQNSTAAPGSEFEAITADAAAPPKGCPIFSLEGAIDASLIPKREWLIEGVFARGFVTLINAPPGSGKTQWLAQLLLSVAHNRSDVGGFPVIEPTRAWSFNAEDDLNELRRRLAGTIIHYKLDKSEFGFALSSGIEDEFCVAKWDASKQSVIRNEKAIAAFTKQIIDNKVGLVILDPMADLHEVPESSNDAIKIVVKIFTKIAIDTNCAVGIATHARKLSGASAEGHAGNADSVRGGGAQTAKARVVKSLMPMTEKECKTAKVDPETRGSYLRIDTAKNNLGPTDRGAKPTWFKWESVLLGNGDKVGVLTVAEIATSRLRQEIEKTDILAAILSGMPEAAEGVSWPKIVLPEFVGRAKMNAPMAKKWFSSLEAKTETSAGLITKIDRPGAAGALLKFTAMEKDDDEDIFA